jgi:ABC-type sugar transport system ATPase subunit
MQPGRDVIVGLRPEHITVTDPKASGTIPVQVSAVEATGSSSYLFTDGDPELVLVTQGTSTLKVGETIGLSIPPHQVHLFDAETQVALREA